MKFKPGDKVVRIIEGAWGLGRQATIIRKCTYFKSDYLVSVDVTIYDDNEVNWHEDSMELEDVYNSPLRKALE